MQFRVAMHVHNRGSICLCLNSLLSLALSNRVWSQVSTASYRIPSSGIPSYRIQDTLLWDTILVSGRTISFGSEDTALSQSRGINM